MKKGPIGVVGAGTMGGGIAQVLAESGKNVLLVDQSPELVGRAIAGIRARLTKRVGQGRLAQEELEQTMANIEKVNTLEGLGRAEIVIEAVFEEANVKTPILAKLEDICGENTLLFSNTSTIPITRLSMALRNPERFAGVHFFNPAPVMRLVEVIRGYLTSDATIDEAVELCASLNKTPVVVRDAAGFVVNRILAPMINEAIFLYAEGTASAEDIDVAMRLGANHPMGPLALADLIGLDVALNVLEVLHEELGDPKYRPAPLLRQLVRAGCLGRKTGQGLHSYHDPATSGRDPA